MSCGCVGMDAAGVATALTRFGQNINNETKAEEGTGLGLPLSQGLVEAPGGIFEIKSELNVGTIVTIELPKDRRLIER